MTQDRKNKNPQILGFVQFIVSHSVIYKKKNIIKNSYKLLQKFDQIFLKLPAFFFYSPSPQIQ
jgi:hypothetical protein